MPKCGDAAATNVVELQRKLQAATEQAIMQQQQIAALQAAAASAAANSQQRQAAHGLPTPTLVPSSPTVPSQFEALVAAAATGGAADGGGANVVSPVAAGGEGSTHGGAANPAAAALKDGGSLAEQAAATRVPNAVDGHEDLELVDDGVDHQPHEPATTQEQNDSMGGGAGDHVARKRAAHAIAAARGVVAKAKARN